LNTVKPTPPDRPGHEFLRGPFLVSLLLAAATLLPALLRPWIRVRADSWFHTAVVYEIERGGIPPQDPYFAGLPLQYMWFFHWIMAGVRQVVSIAPFDLMVIVNGLTLVALTMASADLAAWLARRQGVVASRAATLAAVVVPLGLGVLFWLFLPIRALRALAGVSGGMSELVQLFRLTPLDIPTARAFLSDFGSVPFFLNKFMVGTAYGMALTGFVVYLGALVRFMERPRLATLLVAAPALFLTLMFHPVVGFTTVAVSGLTGMAMLITGSARGGLAIRPLAAWGLAAAAALAGAGPYLIGVTRGKPGVQMVPIHLDWVNVVGLLIGCAFVLVAAFQPGRRLWREARPWGRFLVTWILATFVFASIVRLPGPNTTDKFTYLLYLPLAILASVGLASAWRGPRGVLMAVLLLAPANLIGYASYFCDPDRGGRPKEVNESYDWLRANTPADAIILDSQDRCDVLVSVPRRQYWGREAYAEQWGYDLAEMDRRRSIRNHLLGPPGVAAATFDPSNLEPLIRLGSPIYLIVREEDVGAAAYGGWARAHPSFERAFDRSGIAIYHLMPR